MTKAKIDSLTEEWRRTISFNFGGEGGLEEPDGFKELGVGDDVTLLVGGKVTGLNADRHGSGLTLEVEEVEMVSPKSSRQTIGDLLRELRKEKSEED
jgi:hypothetical protein